MTVRTLAIVAILLPFVPGGSRGEDEEERTSFRVDILRRRSEIDEPAFREAVKSILILQFLELKSNRLAPSDVERIGHSSFRFDFPADLDGRKREIQRSLARPPRVQIRYIAPDHYAEKFPFPSNPEGYQWVKCEDDRSRHVLVRTGLSSGFSSGVFRKPALRRDDAGHPYYSFHVKPQYVDKVYEFKLEARDRIHRVALILDGYVDRELEFEEIVRCDKAFDGREMGMDFSEQERLADALRKGVKREGIRISVSRE